MTEPFLERMIDEVARLHKKLTDLNKFTGTATFAALSPHEQGLLRAQRTAMTDYRVALAERIAFYQKQAPEQGADKEG